MVHNASANHDWLVPSRVRRADFRARLRSACRFYRPSRRAALLTAAGFLATIALTPPREARDTIVLALLFIAVVPLIAPFMGRSTPLHPLRKRRHRTLRRCAG